MNTEPAIVVPLLVNPLRNLWLTNLERYVWLCADPDDGLRLVEASEERQDLGGAAALIPESGHLPDDEEAYQQWASDWIEHERSSMGWEYLLGIDEYRTPDGMATWLLNNGVAPGQAFLVHFDPPNYYRTWTDYGYEYDSDFTYEIVARAPITKEAVEAWADWLGLE